MALKSINWIKTMIFRHKQVKGALLLAISFFTSTALSFEIGVDIASSHGGDKIVKVDNTDNTDKTGNTDKEEKAEKADILIGDGFTIGVVARQKVVSIFDITASISYKDNPEKFENGTYSFKSFPVSVGLRANVHELIALEVGAVTFLNPEITGSLLPTSVAISSDPAQYLEVSFNINEKTEFALRFVSELVFEQKFGGEAKNDHVVSTKGDHVSYIIRAFF